MKSFTKFSFPAFLLHLIGVIALVIPITTKAQTCAECNYYITPAAGTVSFDGTKVKPGEVVCFKSGIVLERIIIKNLVGTKEKPITIKNCGGVVKIVGKQGASYNTVLVQYSKHLKFTGTGDPKSLYGIKVEGGANGISFSELCTDIEVDHVEVTATGFAGIMAKTDPICQDARTWRENFTMYNVLLHHNYVHDIGGEGFYIGNSFYVVGAPGTAACSIADSTPKSTVSASTFKKYAHIIVGVDIYRNVVKRAGCEGIQVGSAPINCKIHDNIIDTSGINPFANFQNNGLQIGNGTGGSVYNNFIRFSPGNGISCLGIGDNILYNNIIIHSGSTDSSTYGSGIFMDEQAHHDTILGPGMIFVNNTIIDPLENGIRIYNDRLLKNVIQNNIVVHMKTAPTFVHKLDKNVIIDEKTNLYLASIPTVVFEKNPTTAKDVRKGKYIDHVKYVIQSGLFESPKKTDYRIKAGSIAAGKGTSTVSLGITFDINNYTGTANDIGAFALGTPVYPLSVLETKIKTNQENSFFVYPNPVAETVENITMKFNMGTAGFVSVQSFDTEGKLQDTFGPQFFNAGWNEWTTTKASNQATKGALVFKLVANGIAQDSQIVILK